MWFSQYTSCDECGQSVHREYEVEHECDVEKRTEYIIFRMRDEINSFEEDFEYYLTTSHGKFDTWLARRDIES